MPMIVTLEGSEQLRSKLGRFGARMEAEAEAIVAEAANFALERTQQLAPRDLGAGAEDIYAVVTGLHAEIISPDDWMTVQEFGRMAGARMPPPGALAGWAQRHGWTASLWHLADVIGRQGIRAKLFMTRAGKETEGFMQARLARASANLQTWWGGSD